MFSLCVLEVIRGKLFIIFIQLTIVGMFKLYFIFLTFVYFMLHWNIDEGMTSFFTGGNIGMMVFLYFPEQL